MSSAGLPDLTKVSVTVTGLTPDTVYYAAVCDGIPVTDPNWNYNSDCGAPTSGLRSSSTGTATFTANSQSYTVGIWHGDGNYDQTYGGATSPATVQPFNCLAPDDDPNAATTTDGGLEISSGEPAWGATAGGNAANATDNDPTVPGTNPCQIVVANNINGSSPAQDAVANINLTNDYVAAVAPESPVAIGLPIAGAVLLGGGVVVVSRRRRKSVTA
jgi:LPXTG-motif cell wall-anchored protein